MMRVGKTHTDRRLLYRESENEITVIKIQDKVEEAKIYKGITQGCTPSTTIFNVYIQCSNWRESRGN